jgi:C1A family cysteine protease
VSNKFKDHKKVVDTINSITDLWEATNYHEFSSMTIGELNNFAGRKKKAHPYRFHQSQANNLNDIKLNLYQNSNSIDIPSYNNVNLSTTGYKNNRMQKSFMNLYEKYRNPTKIFPNAISKNKDLKFNEMPRNYKRDMAYMNKARNQGSCGSCYAMSTIAMLEARLRKQTNNAIKERLSIQHILSCSVYNQGCDGGYAYLAMKFGAEVELVPESCMRYKVFIN